MMNTLALWLSQRSALNISSLPIHFVLAHILFMAF